MALFGFFVFGVGSILGIADITWFEVTFQDMLFDVSGGGLTVGSVVALISLGVTYLSNDNDISNMDQFYQIVVAITIGLTVLIPLVPQVSDLVTQNNFLASITVLIMAVGYGAVSFIK
jgi:hypothetical protein